ncbi:Pfs, NB-ARC and Ankyrin domain protein [Sarocladium implicatum]|nr:Pfs, NB-ARC and Ankyrin domain protein [Sarocladium implicatum]
MNNEGVPHQCDRGYVVRQGLIALDNASVQVQNMNFHNYGPSSAERQSLRDSLWFREMKSRENAIDCEHDGTCTWLLDTTQYALWRAEQPEQWHHRLLWIKGKAGAGKSTMMKFAVKNNRKSCRGELILPHFFNARGTALEHTAEGMYRTLLYWLLKELPEHHVKEIESVHEHHKNGAWQIPELVDILDAGLGRLGNRPTTIYIDALDECPTEETRDMLKVCRKIVRNASNSGRQVRVCFASRPYPHITFTDALFLDFSKQDRHLEDLYRYIHCELNIGIGAEVAGIRHQVLKKAEGSFMWAVLVVRLLNSEYDGGRLDQLGVRINEIPGDLYKLYSYTLKRYPEKHEAFLACCQWVTFGRSLLTCSELWWAIRLMVDGHQHVAKQLSKPPTEDDMERYIVDTSKGFIEFRDFYGCRYAQFLHESAREFFRDCDDLRRLCGAQNRQAFDRLGHEAIRDCCVALIEAGRSTMQALIETHGQYIPVSATHRAWCEIRLADGSRRRLTKYAMLNTLHHVRKALARGSDQTAFLADFATRCGPYFLCLKKKQIEGSMRVCYSMISLLLASENDDIIKETQLGAAQLAWEQGQAFGLVDTGPYSPILRALVRWNHDAVHALIGIYLRMRPWSPKLRLILENLAMRWERRSCAVNLDMEDTHPFLALVTKYPNLASFLLLVFSADGAIDPHKDSLGSILDVKVSPLVRLSMRVEYKAWPDENQGAWLQRLHADPVYNIAQSLEVLYLFSKQGLSSLVITFEYQEILHWIAATFEGHGGAGELPVPPGEALEKIKSLICTRQGRLSGLLD